MCIRDRHQIGNDTQGVCYGSPPADSSAGGLFMLGNRAGFFATLFPGMHAEIPGAVVSSEAGFGMPVINSQFKVAAQLLGEGEQFHFCLLDTSRCV